MTRYLFFLLILSTACTKQNTSQQQLVYWSSNNAAEIDLTREWVYQWNKETSNLPIHFQPIPEGQSSEEVILAAVVGKTTPDIYANMWQGSVELYAKAKKLIPLDTLEGFTEFILERSGPETLAEITSDDGHIYQVPWKINPILTLYNKRMLPELGLDSLPRTYEQYLAAAEKAKKDTDGDGYVDHWMGYTSVKVIWYQRFFNFYPLYLAASQGGALVKNNQVAFNNEHAIEVFRFLQTLYKEDYFSKEQAASGMDQFFFKGKILTQWTGPWNISHLNKFKPENFEFDFYPMPVPTGHQGPIYTYADPKNMVLFNTCKEPQEAWEFIKTMISKAGDKRLLELSGQLPRRKDLATDPYFKDYFDQNPKAVIFAQQANYVKGTDNSEVIVEVFDILSQAYEACVIYNKKTPEQAIADAAAAVDLLLGN